MEALAAVSFTANILQFVDYTCHVLNVGKQIRRKGMSESTGDLEKSAESIRQQIDKIRMQEGSITDSHLAGPTLDNLAKECDSIANEILQFVKKFKIEQDNAPALQDVPQQRQEHPDEARLSLLDERAEKEWNEFRQKVQRDEESLKSEKFKLEGLERSVQEYERELEGVLRRNGGKSNPESDNLQERCRSAVQLKCALEDRIKQQGDTLKVDRARLQALFSTKSQHYSELKKLRDREDANFDKTKRRIKLENEKAEANSKAQRKVKELSKAIKTAWNEDKINRLAEKLDRVRQLLLSDVILSIQTSVYSIERKVDESAGRLSSIVASQTAYHENSMEAVRRGTVATETLLQAQSEHLGYIDQSADKRHEELKQIISEIKTGLEEKYLFPALPQLLLGYDPTLKSAALNGATRIENSILTLLHFRSIEDREAQVPDAYDGTCSWMFEDPGEDEPWNNFKLWLEEGQGCYWIEGKAGCGKSTLMKFLSPDPRTMLALKTWSGNGDPLIASCYFWRLGTRLQNSQEGLLRSLLYSILNRRRELISKVFPAQYSAVINREFQDNSDPDIFFTCDAPGCRISFERPNQLKQHQRSQHGSRDDAGNDDDDLGMWTLAELERAFVTLAQQPFKDFKICLFIDGLDEYVGDQKKAVELFKKITERSSIKAVVSSRPEPTFVEAFKYLPSVRVENFTSSDIDHVVRKMLLSHSKMRSFSARNPRLATKLLDTIAKRACGVFLWVTLVAQLLLERLSEGIFPEHLEAVIEQYPDELHSLYEHMFARMNPETRLEAFRLFRTILLAHKVESGVPTALRLSYLEKDEAAYSILKPVKIITAEELQDRISVVESRLRSRCCGLLEIHYDAEHRSPEFQRWEEGRVEFMHRTVSDFFEVTGIQQLLNEDALSTEDEIYEGLIGSLLHRFKSWDFFRLTTADRWHKYIMDIKSFFTYIRRCDLHLGPRQNEYLDELNKGLEDLWRIRALETRTKARGRIMAQLDTHWAEAALRQFGLKEKSRIPEKRPALLLAAGFGLSTYVIKEMQNAEFLADASLQHDSRALAIRLCQWSMQEPDLRERQIEILECLLNVGFNVNVQHPKQQSGDATTAWEDLVYLQPIPSDAIAFEAWTELVEIYVRSGAALDAKLKHFKGAATRPTGRNLITATLEASNSHKVPLEELVLIEKGMNRLGNLLAEVPVADIRPQHQGDTVASQEDGGVALQSPINDYKGASGSSLQYPRRSRGSRKRPGARKAQKSSSSNSTDISDGCARCQAISALRAAGFNASQIYRALDERGLTYGISGLANSILSTTASDQERLAAESSNWAGAIEPPQDNRVAPADSVAVPVEKTAKSPFSTDATGRQWRVVSRKGKTPDCNAVVGAHWVDKPKTTKPRRPKTLKVVATNSTDGRDSNNNSNAIELPNGTFTWFFDPGEKSISLTLEQKNLLVEVIQSIVSA